MIGIIIEPISRCFERKPIIRDWENISKEHATSDYFNAKASLILLANIVISTKRFENVYLGSDFVLNDFRKYNVQKTFMN